MTNESRGLERSIRPGLFRFLGVAVALTLLFPQSAKPSDSRVSQASGATEQENTVPEKPRSLSDRATRNLSNISSGAGRWTSNKTPIIFTTADQAVVDTTLPTLEVTPLDNPIEMEFRLDWTECRMHFPWGDSAAVFNLGGTVTTSSTIRWNLATISPSPQGAPLLYFVHDVLDRAGPGYGADIPLSWEISIDNSPYQPVSVQSDNSLMVTFFPGTHVFSLRATGIIVPSQDDGYYQLQLGQTLVPEL